MKLTRWDVVDHLENDERIVGYLEAVLEDGPADHIANALVNIARAKGLFNTNGETLAGRACWKRR